jgi:hypothetical protein
VSALIAVSVRPVAVAAAFPVTVSPAAFEQAAVFAVPAFVAVACKRIAVAVAPLSVVAA